MAQKISVITLGCAKNLVDSETLITHLKGSGLDVVHDPEEVDGGAVIINTCGFIQAAKEESVDTILQFARARKEGRIEKLVVMGCLSQRYGKELQKEIPEVDRFFGVRDLASIVRSLDGKFQNEAMMDRYLTTPGHYAWVKISEGCDRSCAFCSIPAIRGRHISRPPEEIIHEVEHLSQKGVREIMLIAQDLSWYGRDFHDPHALRKLLKQLVKIRGIEWIRLHYAYPAAFPWEITALMREEKKICNYLDIPFQHISDKVLKMMRRGYGRQDVYGFIRRIRAEVPGIVLRTTLLTGHPGEGAGEFDELLQFVRETAFDRLGIFPYSHEEGTWAGDHYRDEVPELVKQDRARMLMEIQEEIMDGLNQAQVGQKLPVVVDFREGKYWIGRTALDSPEVDREVLIPYVPELHPGSVIQVTVTGSGPYELTAEVTG